LYEEELENWAGVVRPIMSEMEFVLEILFSRFQEFARFDDLHNNHCTHCMNPVG